MTHVCVQRASDCTPYPPEVLLAVLGEERGKGGFFGECTALVVRGLERVDFPLHNRFGLDLSCFAIFIRGLFFVPTLRRNEYDVDGSWGREGSSLVNVIGIPC